MTLRRVSGDQAVAGRLNVPEHLAVSSESMCVESDSSPEPALVPELLVTDVTRSIEFWCGLCGFEVAYDRS